MNEIIQDIRKNCPCENFGYCPLEGIVKSHSARFLEQYKCIEAFKYNESKKLGRDIGKTEACLKWIEEGYALAFADVYKDGMKHEEIYQKILEKVKPSEFPDLTDPSDMS